MNALFSMRRELVNCIEQAYSYGGYLSDTYSKFSTNHYGRVDSIELDKRVSEKYR